MVPNETTSTRVLYVVHLDDEVKHLNAFKRIFSSIRSSLSEFFTDSFQFTDHLSPHLTFVPRFDFEHVPVRSVEELRNQLIDKGGHPTAVAQNLLFLVLDFFLKGKDDPSGAITEQRIDGVTVQSWLNSVVPHVPVILLTQGGEKACAKYEKEFRAHYKNKDILSNPADLLRFLNQKYAEWWRPDFEMELRAYAGEVGKSSWHTPGHNSGNAFLQSPFQRGSYNAHGAGAFRMDLSVSVEALGDLSEPDLNSSLKSSRERAADIFGSYETLYITNGTSTSNKAMLMTLLRPGEIVLVDRNCHKSVHQAIVMSGARPEYLKPCFHRALGIWAPLTLEQIADAVSCDYPDGQKPRMLILTTCTYEGVLYPVRQIGRLCKQNGILFYADEAWAPYLRFHPTYTSRSETGDRFRYNAVETFNAHFAAQSTHKGLAAFSQASMIHISNDFVDLFSSAGMDWDWLRTRFMVGEQPSYAAFRHRLFEVLRYWHSTSPHYPMLATLDKSGIQMRLEGMRLLQERIEWAEALRKELEAEAPGSVVGLADIVGAENMGQYKGYMHDSLKLVFQCRTKHALGILKDKLSAEALQWEKTSEGIAPDPKSKEDYIPGGCVEFLITIGTFYNHIQDLQKVLKANANLLGPPDVHGSDVFDKNMADAKRKMLPRKAADSDGRLVLLDKAKGKVSAQMVVPYPPGIPVFLPGFTITKEALELVKGALEDGKDVHGILEDGGKHYIRVV